MKTLFVFAALALASTTASADLVCDRCTGQYLGSYWHGDRGTFKSQKFGPLFAGTILDRYYVIDANDYGELSVAVTGPMALRLDVMYDDGSICGPVDGTQVFAAEGGSIFGDSTISDTTRPRISGAVVVPGRWVLRITGPVIVGASYTGTVTFKSAACGPTFCR